MKVKLRNYLHEGLRYAGMLSGRRVYCGPKSVQIGITDFCNFNCIYCTVHSELTEATDDYGDGRQQNRHHRMHPSVMALDTYQELIRGLNEIHCRKVSLIGVGEPFLHKNIMDIIDFSKDRVWLHIVSNGSMISEEMADEIAGKVNHLNISIDAGTPATHSRIHRPAKPVFDRIKMMLLCLQEAKKRKNVALPELSLSTVLCRDNLLEVDRIFDLALELDVKTVDFSVMGAVRETQHLQIGQEDVRSSEFLECLEAARETIRRGGLRTNLFHVLDTYDLGGPRSRDLQRGLPCYVGWVFLRVFPNGDVHPCCGCDRILGNIHEQSIRDIWRATAYGAFRAEARTLHKKGGTVRGCRCHDCAESFFNLDVHRILHPGTRRSTRKRAAPFPTAGPFRDPS